MGLSPQQEQERDINVNDLVVKPIIEDFIDDPTGYDFSELDLDELKVALTFSLQDEVLDEAEKLVDLLFKELGQVLTWIKEVNQVPLTSEGPLDGVRAMHPEVNPICMKRFEETGEGKKEILTPFWQELYYVFAKQVGWKQAKDGPKPGPKPVPEPEPDPPSPRFDLDNLTKTDIAKKTLPDLFQAIREAFGDKIANQLDEEVIAGIKQDYRLTVISSFIALAKTKVVVKEVDKPTPLPTPPTVTGRMEAIALLKAGLDNHLATDFQEYMDWFFSMGPDARQQTIFRLMNRSGSYEKMDNQLCQALVRAMSPNIHYWPN